METNLQTIHLYVLIIGLYLIVINYYDIRAVLPKLRSPNLHCTFSMVKNSVVEKLTSTF